MIEPDPVKHILTTPPPISADHSIFLTGNEYISLPEIGSGAEINSLNVLHMAARGLLEFSGKEGEPLLCPYLSLNGENLSGRITLNWRYELDWLPIFEGAAEGPLALKGEIVIPPGYRGGFLRLTITSNAASAVVVEAGWQGCWSKFNQVIFNRREIKGERIVAYDHWTKSLILEARSGLPLAAVALSLEPEGSWQIYDGTDSFRGSVKMDLAPGETATATLYLAVNLEADGAGTTAVDLRRRGAGNLFEEAVEWLQQRRYELTDPALMPLFHRNLYFNYFFALGRALDTGGLVPVTSRSPRYYVSAAFWSRDALLWSFPGLLITDQVTARELLLAVFSRHLEKAGEHAHYIDGILLYPGFELDQLAAYFLALEQYELFTGDRSLLDEELIIRGLAILADKAQRHYDPHTGLYRTFLDPSDDPVQYPFLVYDNALLQRGFAYLARLQAEERWGHYDIFTRKAEKLQQAIYRHGTVKGPHGTMFAWAVDGSGKFQLYDNPPGSLQLLTYYGFCSPEDMVFRNTVAWIRSANNPYYHQGCAFEEAGSLHCSNPWPLAAANDLLTFNTGGTYLLINAPMDSGFCCETIDPDTGRATTGAAFASGAGFLAYALWCAGRKKDAAEEETAGIANE